MPVFKACHDIIMLKILRFLVYYMSKWIHAAYNKIPCLNPFWCRASRGKKNQRKVSRRIHKAEREKQKREHLNELFLGLYNALGNLCFFQCLCFATFLFSSSFCFGMVTENHNDNVHFLANTVNHF